MAAAEKQKTHLFSELNEILEKLSLGGVAHENFNVCGRGMDLADNWLVPRSSGPKFTSAGTLQ